MTEAEIFRVEVNEEGRRLLQRFARLSLVILAITLLFGTLQTGTSLFYLLKTAGFSPAERSIRFTYYFTATGAVLGFVLQVAQVILYRRFGVLAFKAVAEGDTVAFNRSFRLLNLQAVCFLLQVIVTMLLLFLRLFLVSRF